MGFIVKSVTNEQNFGADLKELRRLRGWSRQELSKASGIPVCVIKSLENENFSELDNPFYHERHVRALVKALDGRVPFFVGKYRAALKKEGYDPKTRAKDYSFTKKVKPVEFFTATKYLPFLLLLPFFFLLGYYVWNEAKIFRQSPELILIQPDNYQTIHTPRITVKGITDPNASVHINGMEAVVEPNGEFAYNLDVPRGLTKLNITAKRRYGLETSMVRYITYNPIVGPMRPEDSIRYFHDFNVTSTSATSTSQNPEI